MNLIATCERLRELEQRGDPVQLKYSIGDNHVVINSVTGREVARFALRSQAEGYDIFRNAAPDLLAVLNFREGDADLLDLFADYISHFKPTGHLKDKGVGANITNQGAAESLRRLADMARKMEASR